MHQTTFPVFFFLFPVRPAMRIDHGGEERKGNGGGTGWRFLHASYNLRPTLLRRSCSSFRELRRCGGSPSTFVCAATYSAAAVSLALLGPVCRPPSRVCGREARCTCLSRRPQKGLDGKIIRPLWRWKPYRVTYQRFDACVSVPTAQGVRFSLCKLVTSEIKFH